MTAVVEIRMRWLLLAPALLALACGARDIPKPKPVPSAPDTAVDQTSPDASPVDAPVTPDAPRVDGASDGAPTADARLLGAGDALTSSDASDAPLACLPTCSATEICTNGQCESLCNPGEAACLSGCADMMTDAKNCGKCETACPAGQFCSNGQCAMACGVGETRCGQSCVKLDTNTKNCSLCGRACAGAEVCAASKCTCVAPNQICGGTCMSVRNNRKNCGRCDNACAGDFVCNATTCGCPSGRKRCPNKATNTCVTDLNDCCSGGQAWCDNVNGGSCVSILTDEAHCGGCNKPACPGAQRCAAGKCSCPAVQPHSCADGTCLVAGACCTNETSCPGQTPSCVPKGTCCPDEHLCGTVCVKNGTCCADQRDCGAGRCIAKTACCNADEHLCSDESCATCCADELSCGGVCRRKDGAACCATADCPANSHQVCNMAVPPRCECPSPLHRCGSDPVCRDCCADPDCAALNDPTKPFCDADKKCGCPFKCAADDRCVKTQAECCTGGASACGAATAVTCCTAPDTCVDNACKPPDPPPLPDAAP